MEDPLGPLLHRSEAVLLDGGLGTTLAEHGSSLRDTLWSARLLVDDPAAIRSAHAAFIEAGAQIVTTASYQLAARSLADAGRDPGLAATLFHRSVELAREGIALARETTGRAGTVEGDEVLVAASVGPYGAVLADGSEYRGHYGLTAAELTAFHAPRVEALLEAAPDLLAFETLPSADEVAAIAPLLAGTGVPAWVSVTVGPDGTTTAEGQPLIEALAPVLHLEEVIAVGVNCCPPELIEPALAALSALDRRLVAYPNLGRRWDPGRRTWQGDTSRRGTSATAPRRWIEAGARVIGGCCGTTPSDLADLARTIA